MRGTRCSRLMLRVFAGAQGRRREFAGNGDCRLLETDRLTARATQTAATKAPSYRPHAIVPQMKSGGWR